MASVPLAALTPAERLAHHEFSIRTAKGEAAMAPAAGPVELADAFEDDEPDTLSVMVWASAGSLMTADMDRGETLIRRATVGARALGDPRVIIAVASTASYRAQINGQPDMGARLVKEALATTGRHPWNGIFMLLGNLAWCDIVAGRYSDADAVLCDALASLKHPNLSLTVWEHLVENAAALWTRTGEWERARALLEESEPWWDEGFRSSNARLATLDLLQHGTSDAEGWFALLSGGYPDGAPLALIHDVVARGHIAAGDLESMRTDLLGMWSHPQVVLSDDQLWATVLLAARAEADAAVEGGDVDRDAATTHMSMMKDLAARFRRFGPLGDVWPLDLAAQLDRFHGRDPRRALTAALHGWDRIGHLPDAAIARLSLAEADAAHGDRDAAREHLASARATATALRAGPMLARADRISDRFALGARERRTSDVLTDRESEVLRLLAEGRTNAEIAATLFMSPKTASVHVSRIIAKLGAANRTEAAAIARRHGLVSD
jgi:DNA-binding CsgD family transcriptional regulator